MTGTRHTRWRLGETLRRHGKTPLALARASGLSKNTVYDIANGTSRGVELETLDKLLSGLERLTGERAGLQDLLDAAPPADPYAEVFARARPFDREEVRKLIPDWTPEERAENERLTEELERQRLEDRELAPRRQDKLDALFAELDALENDPDEAGQE